MSDQEYAEGQRLAKARRMAFGAFARLQILGTAGEDSRHQPTDGDEFWARLIRLVSPLGESLRQIEIVARVGDPVKHRHIAELREQFIDLFDAIRAELGQRQ